MSDEIKELTSHKQCARCKDVEDALRKQVYALSRRECIFQEEIKRLVDQLDRYKLVVDSEELEERKVSKVSDFQGKIRSLEREVAVYKQREAVIKNLDEVQLRDANAELKRRVMGIKKKLFLAKEELSDLRGSAGTSCVTPDQEVYVLELMKLVDKLEKQGATMNEWQLRYRAAEVYVASVQHDVSALKDLLAKRLLVADEPDAAMDEELFYSELSRKTETLWDRLSIESLSEAVTKALSAPQTAYRALKSLLHPGKGLS